MTAGTKIEEGLILLNIFDYFIFKNLYQDPGIFYRN